MNYEELLKKIKTLEKVQGDIRNQIYIEKRIDKTGLKFNLEKEFTTGISSYRLAQVTFNAHHGYYGDSSCHDDMSEDLALYIVRAMNKLRDNIALTAIDIINEDIKKIANNAKSDAEKIITICLEKEPNHGKAN